MACCLHCLQRHSPRSRVHGFERTHKEPAKLIDATVDRRTVYCGLSTEAASCLEAAFLISLFVFAFWLRVVFCARRP